LLAPLFSLHTWIVYRTSRCATGNDDAALRYLGRDKPVIACFWHGRLMGMFVFCVAVRDGKLGAGWPRAMPLHGMVSRRNEGRLFEMALRLLRVPRVVGATGDEGTAAARSIRSATARGSSVLMAPDGPRGPVMRASAGTIRLAALSGAPLLPIGCGISRGRGLRTWDRLVVPWPFGRLVYVFGEPIEVPKRVSDERLGALQRLLEERLTAATVEADRLSGKQRLAPPDDIQ
jgi:lysophospholipid acyltransferase (LPLAT)-like uncharacterized protein